MAWLRNCQNRAVERQDFVAAARWARARRVVAWLCHPWREVRGVLRRRKMRRFEESELGRATYAELARRVAEAEARTRRNPGHNPYI